MPEYMQINISRKIKLFVLKLTYRYTYSHLSLFTFRYFHLTHTHIAIQVSCVSSVKFLQYIETCKNKKKKR